MQKKRVVFFSHDAELYGASRSLVTLVVGLEKEGIECLIIVPDRGPLVDLLIENSLQYYITFYASWYFKSQKRNLFKGIVRSLRLIRSYLQKINDRRLSKHLRECDVVVSNTSSIGIGILLALLHKKPHIWHIREFGDLDYDFRFILGKSLFYYLLSKSRLILFNSHSTLNYFTKHINKKIPQGVIYNGVYSLRDFDANINNKSRVREQSQANFIFSIIGYIHAGKGQFQAVDAFNTLTHEFNFITLNIVGNGDIKELKKHIERTQGWKNIQLTGYIKNIKEILLSTDCVLNCSRYEAFGRTIAEAMSYGIPAIGNDSGGVAELIANNVTGLLYDGSTEDLVRKMRYVVENPHEAKKLGMTGWEKAKKEYNIERYVDQYATYLKKVLLD